MAAGVRISMDGRGRWMDNVFIERLWRSLKHEEYCIPPTSSDNRLAQSVVMAQQRGVSPLGFYFSLKKNLFAPK
jgi:hypothetical protein